MALVASMLRTALGPKQELRTAALGEFCRMWAPVQTLLIRRVLFETGIETSNIELSEC